jgi:DUF4097 and DUF4098 domain-containing protein YvlB
VEGVGSRTETFSENGPVRSLEIEGLNGPVTIRSGATFSAKIEIIAKAADKKRAAEVLETVKVKFTNRGGALTLDARSYAESEGRRWSRNWNAEIRQEITLPRDARLEVSLVNGALDVSGIEGDLTLSTVNGALKVEGGGRHVELQTVNGEIVARLLDLPKGAEVEAKTVNGAVTIRLPKGPDVKLRAHTMNGDIVSTLPFPASARDREAEQRAQELSERAEEKSALQKERLEKARQRARAEADRKAARAREAGEETRETARLEAEIEREVEREMRSIEREMERVQRELDRMGEEIGRSVELSLNRSYEGTLGRGNAELSVETLNGRIAILEDGSAAGEARTLLGSRRSRYMIMPNVVVRPRVRIEPPVAPVAPVAPVPPVGGVPPVPPVAPVAPVAPIWKIDEERGIVKGDIEGDFVASISRGEIRLGKVSGEVRVRTSSGEIRVVSVGKDADLLTRGGGVRVDDVKGSLRATTYGGDLVVGSIAKDARLETKGGDVLVRKAGGPVTARSGGGDIELFKVSGAVTRRRRRRRVRRDRRPRASAETSLTSNGGTTLTLPANFKGDLEVRVNGFEDDPSAISSEFDGITVIRVVQPAGRGPAERRRVARPRHGHRGPRGHSQVERVSALGNHGRFPQTLRANR